MKSSKRTKLKAAGWAVGSPAEFLKLTTAESALIEVRVSLGRLLRELRTRRGLTQAQAAGQLKSSQSRLAKMEAADPTVSIDLLVRSLMTLGATRREIAQALAG